MESISAMKVLYYNGGKQFDFIDLPEDGISQNTIAFVTGGLYGLYIRNAINPEESGKTGVSVSSRRHGIFVYRNKSWFYLVPEATRDDINQWGYTLQEMIDNVNARVNKNTSDIESLDTRMSAAETKLEKVEKNVASYPTLSIDASIGNINTSYNTLYIGFMLFTTLYLHSTTEQQEFTVTITYDENVNLLPGHTFSIVSNNTEVEVSRPSNTQLNCSIKNMPVGTTQILLISNCM